MDHRSRQLTTYPTADEASQAVRAVVAVYRDCPVTPRDPGGFRSHYEVGQTAYGDESWSVAATETQGDGYPTTSLVVLHVIRVGRAVLETSDAGEGGAAPPEMLAQHVAGPADDAAAVIEAMRVYGDG